MLCRGPVYNDGHPIDTVKLNPWLTLPKRAVW